jgi:hypothetical protein
MSPTEISKSGPPKRAEEAQLSTHPTIKHSSLLAYREGRDAEDLSEEGGNESEKDWDGRTKGRHSNSSSDSSSKQEGMIIVH